MELDAGAYELPEDRERARRRGRVSILYALGQHYLFLPVAALCMAASLQIAATVFAESLKRRYDARDKSKDDSELWAKRYSMLSAVVGAIWSLSAVPALSVA